MGWANPWVANSCAASSTLHARVDRQRLSGFFENVGLVSKDDEGLSDPKSFMAIRPSPGMCAGVEWQSTPQKQGLGSCCWKQSSMLMMMMLMMRVSKAGPWGSSDVGCTQSCNSVQVSWIIIGEGLLGISWQSVWDQRTKDLNSWFSFWSIRSSHHHGYTEEKIRTLSTVSTLSTCPWFGYCVLHFLVTFPLNIGHVLILLVIRNPTSEWEHCWDRCI